MKLQLKSLALALVIGTGVQAQNTDGAIRRTCGTQIPSEEWNTWFNQKVEEQRLSLSASKTQSTNYTIPVVFHIIHGGQNVGTYPNLSQAQINSQIPILNNDFAGIGLNVGNLAATGFSAVGAADCSISFCLAQLDPDGNVLTEPGIDRVNYVSEGFNNPASAPYGSSGAIQTHFNGTIKPATIWDPVRYLNIWVSDTYPNTNLLGYATFPGNSGLTGISGGAGGLYTDGVYVWARALGNTGAAQWPYNQGRTATHEIGHWLGLRHIGGDGNNNINGDCNATDYCNDTPPQRGGYAGGEWGQNYGSPTYPLYATGSNSCAGAPFGNMFMNFMDYGDDAAIYMFTPDQSTRMTTAMTNGTYRKHLTASSATMCGLVFTAPQAAFTVTNTVCVDGTVQVNNQSAGTPTPGYVWSVLPSSAGVSFNPSNSDPNPVISFALFGDYTVQVTATSGGGTSTYTRPVSVVECNTSGVGIEKVSAFQNSISLFPNPSTGVVEISTSMSAIQQINIEVRNYLGQLISTENYNPSVSDKYVLDLNNYSNGVYFITLQSGTDKAVKRIILNK